MTAIDLSLGVYIALAINGIFTGLGVAVGTYLAQKHLIDGSKRLIKRIRRERIGSTRLFQ